MSTNHCSFNQYCDSHKIYIIISHRAAAAPGPEVCRECPVTYFPVLPFFATNPGDATVCLYAHEAYGNKLTRDWQSLTYRLAAFFLTGQTWSDPAWPFFFACRRQNDRPDRVRPGLAIQKNAANIDLNQNTVTYNRLETHTRKLTTIRHSPHRTNYWNVRPPACPWV